MTNKPNWLQLLICSFLIFTTTPANAQITPDNTLGAENSRLTPNILINGASADRIDGGATRGSNLFHSFTQFSINNGQRVYFGNPVGIENILTRVTGKEASNIFGTLGVNGTANLFLINPNGILFGKNAQLDIRGSFLGTTANSLVFPNGVEFSATNPQAPPLLTISVPIGLQVGTQPGRITSQASQLGVSGSTLALIGGETTLDGSFLFALDGQMQLGAVAGDTTVGLQVNNSSLGFSVPENARLSPITLSNAAYIYTSGNSAIKFVGGNINLKGSYLISQDGGSISINATGLGLNNNSLIRTFTQGAAKAGDIQIQARDAVTLTNSSIRSESNNPATGNGGNISIIANQLGLDNNSLIRTFTQSAANAGDIQIQARDAVTLANSQIASQSNNLATGNGGNISIAAGNITVAGNGTASTTAINTFTNSQGNAGNLILDATDINITQGGFVTVMTAGAGNTGDLTVRARKSVNVTNNGSLALSAQSSGSTGNLRIETGTFKVENTTGVGAFSNGAGSAGSIFIQARDAVEVIDSQVSAYAEPKTEGRIGDITIETQRLNLTNGGGLDTNTYGAADAGNILIRASKSVELGGVSPSNYLYSYILSGTAGIRTDNAGNIIEATGNGGNITIETPRLTLSEGAEVGTSSSQSRGNAGNITIRAKDVELDGFVTVPNVGFSRTKIVTNVADSETDVKGGTLTIDTERLRVSNGGYFDTSVQSGRGQAGNLVVRAVDFIDISGVGPENRYGEVLPSGLFANVQTGGIGSGGSINVETKRLNMSDGGQISAATFAQGNAGNVLINADQIDLHGESTGILTSVNDQATGNAGEIRINTQRLNLQDGADISSATFGNGNAGNLTIRANDITLNGVNSNLLSSVNQGANGNGGTLNISSDRLTIRNGAGISSRTAGLGRAGNIRIDANDSITLDGIQSGSSSFISARSTPTATKGSGDITLNTNALNLNQGASLIATTENTESGGNISINANTIDLTNGGQILTSTSSSGSAGTIALNALHIKLTGVDSTYAQRLAEFGRPTVNNQGEASGLYASTTKDSSGQGGSIGVNARQLNISDRASISVDSQGSGVAGNIKIKAQSVQLRDRANIVAETASQDGGNINLKNTDLLLLRRGSFISTTAAEGGNGGNINIDAKVIVAVPKEDSDIRANAVRGRGGNVTIKTDGLFGITPALFPTVQSDITASSQVGIQGQINIIQPDVQPTQGLIELPNQVIDASNQIAQDCPRSRNAKKPLGNFIVTGRGIPPNATQPLNGTLNLTQLATLDSQSASTKPNTSSIPKLPPTSPTVIVEAQGWVKTPDGKIMLVAQVPTAPTATTTSAACPVYR